MNRSKAWALVAAVFVASCGTSPHSELGAVPVTPQTWTGSKGGAHLTLSTETPRPRVGDRVIFRLGLDLDDGRPDVIHVTYTSDGYDDTQTNDYEGCNPDATPKPTKGTLEFEFVYKVQHAGSRQPVTATVYTSSCASDVKEEASVEGFVEVQG